MKVAIVFAAVLCACAGAPGGSEALSPPESGLDAATLPQQDAGPVVADAGPMTADAGTAADGGASDAGPDAGPVDAGPTAAEELARFDAGTAAIDVVPTTAPCAALLPRAIPPPQLRKLINTRAASYSYGGFLVDADGDIAVSWRCCGMEPFSGIDVAPANGEAAGMGGGLVTATEHGFLSYVDHYVYGSPNAYDAWSNGAWGSLQHDPNVPDRSTPWCRVAAAGAGYQSVCQWTANSLIELQRRDATFKPLTPALTFNESVQLIAIDVNGLFLTSTPSEGLRWRTADGHVFSDRIDGAFDRPRPLAGGGIDTTQGVFEPGATTPSPRGWLAEHDTLIPVLSGLAYATPTACAIEVRSRQGDLCGTLAVRDDAGCAPWAIVGPRGTIAQRAAATACKDALCVATFRVWPRLLE